MIFKGVSVLLMESINAYRPLRRFIKGTIESISAGAAAGAERISAISRNPAERYRFPMRRPRGLARRLVDECRFTATSSAFDGQGGVHCIRDRIIEGPATDPRLVGLLCRPPPAPDRNG